MNISELHANEELRRHEFPVSREKVFLAHAGVCPVPRRVAEAVCDYARLSTLGDQETLLPAMRLSQSRERAARLIGAKPAEIAFVGPTSLGLSMVAGGLKFRRNENVVIYFDDYPSNVYPWMKLADRGVQVRFLNVRELGRIRDVDIMGQVDENTRLVALASCHFLAGWRIDLTAIGEYLRKKRILFCVDGIQTVGAFPTNTAHFDFMAADSHKWMLGPCGAGILYVREEVQDQLRPMVWGWNNVYCPQYVAQEEMKTRPGGARYEAGSHNLLGLVGLNAAMELLLEVGVENIATELLRKRSMLVPLIEAKGYTVLQSSAPTANASGIMTFFRAGTDMAALHQKLEAAGIVASLRADRSGQQHLRFSPHFYNTDEELGRAVELL